MSFKPVVMYLTEWCPYCRRAQALLASKGIPFTAIDVDAQPERRAEMTARSQRRSVPQIFIGERHIGGCDDLYALNERGELDQLVQGAS